MSRSRPSLIRLTLSLVAVLAVAMGTTTPSSALTGSGAVEVSDLGPASEVTATGVGEEIGGHIWTATSGVKPVKVGAYNIATHVIDRTIDLPTGVGVWGTAHIGTDLYVGTYTPGDLYRIDTTTGAVRKVANFGSFIWSLTASPDGRIFAGTFPDAGVWEYDPASGTTKKYGTVAPGEQYVRGIAVSATTIYAGIGSHAQLIAIDRATGARRNILPAKYVDRTFVATMELSGNTLAVSLSPTGTMLVFDTADETHPTEVQLPNGDLYITAITVNPADGALYLGSRASGTLWRWTRADGLTPLGQPYDGAYFNRIFVDGSIIRGSLSSQIVEFDTATGTFTGHDLVAAGLPPAPEIPFQLAATDHDVLVSGKAGIQVHQLATGASTRVFLPGEAKTMTPLGSTVYLGVYTNANLYSINEDGSDLTHLSSFGNEQTRPTDAVFDDASGQLLVTTEADYGRLNGALGRFNPVTTQLSVQRGIVPNQSVRSVAVRGDVAYLGSQTLNSLGTTPIVKNATVSAVDIATGAVRYQVTPVVGAQAIVDLVVYRGLLYGATDVGTVFVLDPRSGAVLHTVAVGVGSSRLVMAGGALFGSDARQLYQLVVTPQAAPVVHTVVSGLNPYAEGPVLLTASPDGATIYTTRNRHLVAVTNLPGPNG